MGEQVMMRVFVRGRGELEGCREGWDCLRVCLTLVRLSVRLFFTVVVVILVVRAVYHVRVIVLSGWASGVVRRGRVGR